ncbi:DUF7521 family protein [Halopelagius longus]|uniref:YapH protein n=1 Tax=Halopelagius longus TaxID=1236180 RepID=A0A1H1BS41_9EURY|nr:hypothetical protein [Halopelagius longus]RDI70901.1 hypothetical protein DWB78_03685 [Halopelagius longus]SDQ54762.1 hypothetical protein SAMN05216278_1925 [Halopelagius longus]
MPHTTASPAVTTALIIVKTGILILGGLITYFSFKAYRRTRSPALRALAIGFSVVTFGALIAGVIDTFLDVSLAMGVLIDSALTFIGFAVITYSLYVD